MAPDKNISSVGLLCQFVDEQSDPAIGGGSAGTRQRTPRCPTVLFWSTLLQQPEERGHHVYMTFIIFLFKKLYNS